jgi:uncharacterized protein
MKPLLASLTPEGRGRAAGSGLSDAEIERLRQSGIRLDAEGRFWHEGGEVTHEGMRQAFFRWLDRNPDGRWVLRLDERRFVYLDVDDAPFVVTSLHLDGERIRLHLIDDSEEELDYDTLTLRDGTAYATVKGRFPARFSRPAWNTLGERLEERDGGVYLRTPDGPRRLG